MIRENRRSMGAGPYGFRTYEHAEIALYHALGNLPEPDWLTHRFA